MAGKRYFCDSCDYSNQEKGLLGNLFVKMNYLYLKGELNRYACYMVSPNVYKKYQGSLSATPIVMANFCARVVYLYTPRAHTKIGELSL